jgi:hypothetical protein
MSLQQVIAVGRGFIQLGVNGFLSNFLEDTN